MQVLVAFVDVKIKIILLKLEVMVAALLLLSACSQSQLPSIPKTNSDSPGVVIPTEVPTSEPTSADGSTVESPDPNTQPVFFATPTPTFTSTAMSTPVPTATTTPVVTAPSCNSAPNVYLRINSIDYTGSPNFIQHPSISFSSGSRFSVGIIPAAVMMPYHHCRLDYNGFPVGEFSEFSGPYDGIYRQINNQDPSANPTYCAYCFSVGCSPSSQYGSCISVHAN